MLQTDQSSRIMNEQITLPQHGQLLLLHRGTSSDAETVDDEPELEITQSDEKARRNTRKTITRT